MCGNRPAGRSSAAEAGRTVATCRPPAKVAFQAPDEASMTSRNTDAVTILVPGKLHAHALSRLEAGFRVLQLPSADPRAIDPEAAQAVRGVATMTAVDAAFIDALPRLEIIANF